mgnify:CR=1 FL=1
MKIGIDQLKQIIVEELQKINEGDIDFDIRKNTAMAPSAHAANLNQDAENISRDDIDPVERTILSKVRELLQLAAKTPGIDLHRDKQLMQYLERAGEYLEDLVNKVSKEVDSTLEEK